MSLDIGKYERSPFYVDAVQITLDNMEDVAEWCGGEIKRQFRRHNEIVQFIQVEVSNPMSERQGKGFIGNWLLKTNSGYKVYTATAFESCFKAVMPPTPEEIWPDEMLPLERWEEGAIIFEPSNRNDIQTNL